MLVTADFLLFLYKVTKSVVIATANMPGIIFTFSDPLFPRTLAYLAHNTGCSRPAYRTYQPTVFIIYEKRKNRIAHQQDVFFNSF